MSGRVAGDTAAAIRRLIAMDRMVSGQRLPSERELSERLGVSRTSIRTALAELRAIGIVTTHASRGAFVAESKSSMIPASIQAWFEANRLSLSELIEFRRAVEPAASAAAASRRDDEDIGYLSQQLAQMRKATDAEHAVAFAESDNSFHHRIMLASHNRLFAVMTTSVEEALKAYREAAARYGREVLERSLEQHVAIFEAIARGEPEEAYRATQQHIVDSALEYHLVDRSELVPWDRGQPA